jgi:crotonobetainyl-CoA:carnitine CoA-transferase CaiB-like acyl-CoA transferase
VLIGDIGGALHAAFSIVSALLHREQSGRGQYIDVSMMSSMMLFHMDVASRFLRTGKALRPTPLDLGAFRCKDGKYLACAATEARLWEIFMRTIGLPELVTAKMGDEHWPETMRQIEERMLTRTRDEWFAILKEAGTSAAPVLELDEVFEDPHAISRGVVMDLEHPTVGAVRQPSFPVILSDTPAEFRSFAPLRGQHTDEVLAELGYTAEERAALGGTSQA